MRVLAAFCVSLLLVGCGLTGEDPGVARESPPTSTTSPTPTTSTTSPAADLPAMPPFDVASLTLLDPDGDQVEMAVYVADQPATRQQGLMGVTDLPRGAGMVFLSPEDRSGGFWMKNTLIPLSIAFFAADGAVLAVLDMEPCEADPCPIYDPGVVYRGALEVNRGHFDEIGLDTGWRVELPADLAGRALRGSTPRSARTTPRGQPVSSPRRAGRGIR